MTRCIAMREGYAGKSVTFVRCGRKVKKGKSRFCRIHERAYREIILGVAMQTHLTHR